MTWYEYKKVYSKSSQEVIEFRRPRFLRPLWQIQWKYGNMKWSKTSIPCNIVILFPPFVKW